ncbi:hypothetical protein AgCh_040313 [Apium graveolens]
MRPTKILPFNSQETSRGAPIRSDAVKPVLKSRIMRQFRVPEKPITGPEAQFSKLEVSNGAELFEPSSVCLTKMMQNFIEEANEKQKIPRQEHRHLA